MSLMIKIQKEMMDWSMPEIGEGHIVMWWPSGAKDVGPSEIAITQYIHGGRRGGQQQSADRVDIVVLGRQETLTAFYHTDPRLQNQANREVGGCFSFPRDSTPERLAKMEERLSHVDRQLDKLVELEAVVNRIVVEGAKAAKAPVKKKSSTNKTPAPVTA